jgi:microcystin-dependent protein
MSLTKVTNRVLADNSVTLAKLVAAVQEALVPVGAVQAFAMNSTPAGWLAANGDTVPNGNGTVQGVTANFAVLFSVLSTTYGAAGKLPDLRGYFVRGSGTNSDGAAAGSFGVKQQDEIKSHTHPFAYIGAVNTSGRSGDSTRALQSNRTGDTDATGGDETRPKNIAMRYCIKY